MLKRVVYPVHVVLEGADTLVETAVAADTGVQNQIIEVEYLHAHVPCLHRLSHPPGDGAAVAVRPGASLDDDDIGNGRLRDRVVIPGGMVFCKPRRILRKILLPVISPGACCPCCRETDTRRVLVGVRPKCRKHLSTPCRHDDIPLHPGIELRKVLTDDADRHLPARGWNGAAPDGCGGRDLHILTSVCRNKRYPLHGDACNRSPPVHFCASAPLRQTLRGTTSSNRAPFPFLPVS